MTIAAMISQRLKAAERVRFFIVCGRPIDEVGRLMLQRWCKATLLIRIELVKRHAIKATRHRLLSSSEIAQVFGLRDDRVLISETLDAVCRDASRNSESPLLVVKIDDELIVTFGTLTP